MLVEPSAYRELRRQGTSRISYASGQDWEGPPVYKDLQVRIDRQNRWNGRDTALFMGKPLKARKASIDRPNVRIKAVKTVKRAIKPLPKAVDMTQAEVVVFHQERVACPPSQHCTL